MKCIKCGKRLHSGQPICPYCGASQAQADGEPIQMSLSQMSKTGQKKKLTKKQLIIRIAIIVGAALLALAVTAVSIIYAMLGRVQRGSELSGSVGINVDLPTEGVQNIALFGLDTRQNNDVGRSDAVIILSIDQVHNKIKMTSLARDSFVKIEGHGYSKLTHAWAFGKANLAVKTLNQNYGMNITDYAYINFYEFAKLIDYIGGVDVELNAGELDILNNYYAPELNSLGITCPPVAGTGVRHLTGAQALAHSRNRYTGSDIDRGNRQKIVLQAAYDQVKTTPATKLPTMISNVLSLCHTNLTSNEMLSIAYWAMTKQPTFESLSLPTPACNPHGGNLGDGYGWVYRYDLTAATTVLHNFIYETAEVVETQKPSVNHSTVTGTNPTTSNTGTTTTTVIVDPDEVTTPNTTATTTTPDKDATTGPTTTTGNGPTGTTTTGKNPVTPATTTTTAQTPEPAPTAKPGE